MVLYVLLNLTQLQSLALHALGQLVDAQLHGQLRVLLVLFMLLENSEVGHELFDLLLQGDVRGENLHNRYMRHGVCCVSCPKPLLDVGSLVGHPRRGDHRVNHHFHADRADELGRDATQVRNPIQ